MDPEKMMILFSAFLGFIILRRFFFRLRGKEAAELIAKGAAVVDVRSPAEFKSGHHPQAVNIPVDAINAQSLAKIGATSRPVVVYCASGMRSGRAAGKLKALGFERVVNAGTLSAITS